MREIKLASAALGLIIGVLAAEPASAWDRKTVHRLADLPTLVDINNAPTSLRSSIEGITVGLAPDNNIYAASSGINNDESVPPTSPANLFVFSPQGHLVRQIHIGLSSSDVLGIRFNPATSTLWVLDSGNRQVLSTDTTTGASTVLFGPIAGSTLNALTFDSAGNGYVSDSTNGVIYKFGPPSMPVFSTWSNDQLLKPLGPPPAPGQPPRLRPNFGANGIEFSPPGCNVATGTCSMFVANTANRQIIQIPVNADGTAGTAEVFVNGINAPDGIAIDKDRNLWIAANQEDEIVVIQSLSSDVTPSIPGKVIAKLGDFQGLETVRVDGVDLFRVRGLLFPTSLAFSNDGKTLYVANLVSPNQVAIDSAWAGLVTLYTVSKLDVPTIPPTGLFHPR
jgi:sugar lactone lactonase YvrE